MPTSVRHRYEDANVDPAAEGVPPTIPTARMLPCRLVTEYPRVAYSRAWLRAPGSAVIVWGAVRKA